MFFYPDKITSETNEKISFLKNSEILFFENIRLNDGEIENADDFAKNISIIGDLYINDAFSCSHRKQASIHKITKYIKNSYAGPLFMKEILSVNMVLKNIKSPTTCIIGGSKISTKLGVIASLIKKVDNLIIIGAMANNFIKYSGNEVGKSLIEVGSEKMVKEIYKEAEKNNCKIITPVDVALSDNINGDASFKDV